MYSKLVRRGWNYCSKIVRPEIELLPRNGPARDGIAARILPENIYEGKYDRINKRANEEKLEIFPPVGFLSAIFPPVILRTFLFYFTFLPAVAAPLCDFFSRIYEIQEAISCYIVQKEE